MKLQQVYRRRAAGAIAVVVAAFGVLVVLKLAGVGGGGPSASGVDAQARARIVAQVLGVPAKVLDQVGKGEVATLPRVTGKPVLQRDGKPYVLYVGAEYCPFCAAQRWGLVVALSRFGTFEGIGVSASATDDVYPNTATLSFHGSGYHSDYLVFEAVETQSNVRAGSGYAPLEKLTAEQEQLMRTFDAPPYVAQDSAGSIPFVDFGNQLVGSGAAFSPQVLAGLSAEQIAAALSQPDSATARAILGSANAFTAALCRLTGNKPAEVCEGPAATAYQGAFDVS